MNQVSFRSLAVTSKVRRWYNKTLYKLLPVYFPGVCLHKHLLCQPILFFTKLCIERNRVSRLYVCLIIFSLYTCFLIYTACHLIHRSITVTITRNALYQGADRRVVKPFSCHQVSLICARKKGGNFFLLWKSQLHVSWGCISSRINWTFGLVVGVDEWTESPHFD